MPFNPNLSLIGANPTTGSNTAWGMVPMVPDPLSTAATAIGGNLTNLGGLTDLASRVNAFNTQQAVNPYIANLPGYQSMVNQSSGNIGSLLQGQIPADVLNLLGQRSAERGIGTGLAGSPNANSAAMQALGLTSLGLQQQGEGELTQAIGRTPTAPLFNVAQFLTTPGEEQAAQLAANIYRSAPDPQKQAQALIDLFTRFMGRLGQGTGGAPFVTPSGGGPTPYTPPPPGPGGGGGPPGYTAPITRPGGSITPADIFRNVGPAPGATGGFPTGPITPTFPGGPNSFLNQTFAQPAFQNRSTLGNIGLDPVLNALFGSGPGGGSGFGAPIESPGFGYDMNQQGTDFSQLLGSPITAPPLNLGNTGFQQPPVDLSQYFNPAYGNTGTVGMGLDPVLNALFGFGGQTQQPITFGNQPPPLNLGSGGFGAPITSGSLLGGGGATSGLTDAQIQQIIDEGALFPGEEDFLH